MNCAILGFGTVGKGTAELLSRHAEALARQAGEELKLKYILVRRDYPGSEFAPCFITDPGIIWADDSVGLVAEVIGGTGAALDYTRAALCAGKSVVTSNKELVAAYGAELSVLAAEHGVCYLYEGCVAGGIPLVAPLSLCTAGMRVDAVAGILNGTTNYILTAMESSGKDFAVALAEAQALGYAEADPTADVEGLDAARKITILADLLFRCSLDPALTRAKGISSVGAEDFRLAGELGFTIRLLARAIRGGKAPYVFVEPHAVSKSSLLAGVSGVMNACSVRAEEVGELMFYGPGAGKLPTGSAVVADMARAAAAKARPYPPLLNGAPCRAADPAELPSAWYVRVAPEDEASARAAFPSARFVSGGAFTAFATPGDTPLTEQELASRLSPLSPAAAFRVLNP